MTEHTWHTTYARAVKLFDDTPGAQIEHDVLTTFKQHPQLVIAQIEAIGARIKQGAQIRSGWAVLRKQLETAATEDVTISDVDERKQKTARARAWIASAGLYLDEADLHHELAARHVTDPEDLDTLLGHWHERRQQLAARPPLEPEQTNPTPDWVRRWQQARRHADDRLLPEQADGLQAIHDATLREGKPVSGYEHAVQQLDTAATDAGVYVQPWEYAIDDDPEPGTPEWEAKNGRPKPRAQDAMSAPALTATAARATTPLEPGLTAPSDQ